MSGESRGNGSDRGNRSKPEPLYPVKLYPCRICGTMSKNRFYCPEHLRAVSDGIDCTIYDCSGNQRGGLE